MIFTKTIKIIDIFNKMANGEKVPDFIINETRYYVGLDGYLKERLGCDVRWTIDTEWLNNKVKIIEEEKEIEKLKYFYLCKSNEDGDLELTYTGVADTFDEVYGKINELIDAVNELKKEKNNE